MSDFKCILTQLETGISGNFMSIHQITDVKTNPIENYSPYDRVLYESIV